jgi:hypothetical protein
MPISLSLVLVLLCLSAVDADWGRWSAATTGVVADFSSTVHANSTRWSAAVVAEFGANDIAVTSDWDVVGLSPGSSE